MTHTIGVGVAGCSGGSRVHWANPPGCDGGEATGVDAVRIDGVVNTAALRYDGVRIVRIVRMEEV